MPPIRNLRINFDMNNSQTLIINDLNTTDTVKDLKQKIVDRELKNRTVDDVQLIFLGKPLSDNTKKLVAVKIKSNRVLTAIIRVTGGSSQQGEGSIVIDEEALKKLNVKVVKDDCQMHTEESCTSDGTKRIRMPECNYKCTYCVTCLKKQYKKCIFTACSTDVVCGYGNSSDPKNLDSCKGSVLDLDTLFVALSLSEDEQKECFDQLNKNGMKNDPSIKSCPGCGCYVFKSGIDHNRVRCIKQNCPLKQDWCWCCQGTWKGTSSNFKICGNDDCGDSDLAIKIDLLLNCDRVCVDYSNIVIDNVPSIRMCPMCDSFVNYTEGCKHLTCPKKNCLHEFCIACTEDWDGCKCSQCKDNNGTRCSNSKRCQVIEPSDLV